MDEISKTFPKFNTTWRSILIKFKTHVEEWEPETYLKECITALRNYRVDEVADRDCVGLRIRITENIRDNVVGIS